MRKFVWISKYCIVAREGSEIRKRITQYIKQNKTETPLSYILLIEEETLQSVFIHPIKYAFIAQLVLLNFKRENERDEDARE